MEITCSICYDRKKQSELIQLKCDHQFCWICINDYLVENLNCKIKCPMENCSVLIRDAEIRRVIKIMNYQYLDFVKVLSEQDIEQYEIICLEKLKKSHKCLLPQCNTSVIYTDPDVQYSCENCTLYNCIKCQASHSFTSCSDYQSKSPNTKHRICQEARENAEMIFNEKRKIEFRETFLKFDKMNILPNDSVFTCDLCYLVIGKGDGVKLQNCHHDLCKKCLIKVIIEVKKIPVACPYCEISVNDSEIQSILTPDQFLNYLEMCKNYSKRLINHFQCQTVDCDGFYDITESIKEFICKICGIKNCVPCKAVHPDETCNQYQSRKNNNPNSNLNEEQIKNNNIMECLTCGNYLKKTKGCNWIQCPFCSTELCWIKKMLRWGPEGRGDNSGGCRCMVDDIPCDPECTTTCYPHVISFDSSDNDIISSSDTDNSTDRDNSSDTDSLTEAVSSTNSDEFSDNSFKIFYSTI